MSPATALRFLASAALLAAASCSSASGDPPSAPAGLACTAIVNGGSDPASLKSALASAGSGSCVLVGSKSFQGNFVVPAGVTLASGQGLRASFASTDASSAVLEVTGGAGGGLAQLDVTAAAGVGIAVRGGGAKLSDVTVTGAKSAAFAALCTGASCMDDAQVIELDAVTLAKSSLGAWVSGARLTMNGGASTDHTSDTVSGAFGVVAQSGARVSLSGVDIERNGGIGVLIDGKGGTTASLRDVKVSNNSDRGIWAQSLAGTLDAPALDIQGSSSIENNQIVGLGSVASQGIIFVGGMVDNTRAAPVMTNLGSVEQIGDGVGFFGSSGAVRLENVAISANARAGGVIDTAAGAIIFVGGKVDPGPSGLQIVVQNSVAAKASIMIPTADLSAPNKTLGVSAPVFPLTRVLE